MAKPVEKVLALLDEERNASWREEVALRNQIKAIDDRISPHMAAIEFLRRDREKLEKALEEVRRVGYERNQRYAKAARKAGL